MKKHGPNNNEEAQQQRELMRLLTRLYFIPDKQNKPMIWPAGACSIIKFGRSMSDAMHVQSSMYQGSPLVLVKGRHLTATRYDCDLTMHLSLLRLDMAQREHNVQSNITRTSAASMRFSLIQNIQR